MKLSHTSSKSLFGWLLLLWLLLPFVFIRIFQLLLVDHVAVLVDVVCSYHVGHVGKPLLLRFVVHPRRRELVKSSEHFFQCFFAVRRQIKPHFVRTFHLEVLLAHSSIGLLNKLEQFVRRLLVCFLVLLFEEYYELQLVASDAHGILIREVQMRPTHHHILIAILVEVEYALRVFLIAGFAADQHAEVAQPRLTLLNLHLV